MAKSTKSQLAPPANRPTPPPSQTQRVVQGNRTGAPPRDVPKPDARTQRAINEGRALGRDLSPGTKATNAGAGAANKDAKSES